MSTEARAKRYRQLCKEAAKQLGCGPSDELAVHVATLRLCRETFAAKLISGRDVDPTALLKLDETLRQFMLQFAPTEKHTIEFRYVDGDPPAENRRPETHRTETLTSDLPEPGKVASNEAPSTPISAPEPKALWADTGYVPRQDFHAGSPTPADHRLEPWRSHLAIGG